MTAKAHDPIALNQAELILDEDGRMWLSGTRLSLDVLFAAFEQGRTPDDVHAEYEGVALTTARVVYNYFLQNSSQVDAYLAHEEREAAAVQAQVEAEHPLSDTLLKKLRPRLDT